MRHRLASLAAMLFLVASCADSPTTPSTSELRPFTGPRSSLTLDEYIQQSIQDFLPNNGYRAWVVSGWASVKNKKLKGELAVAKLHLGFVVKYIQRRTQDITPPPGITKEQAAAILVVNMSRWVFDGADSPVTDVPTGDAAIAIVPARAVLNLVTPSEKASVHWDANSTQEDRVVVIIEDESVYPAQCQGPLQTRRCQYPLFYRVESFPDVRLSLPGKLAVCLVTTGDRRPIEYPAEDHDGPVHSRLRLAHDLPPDPSQYTPGATQEDGIEILPRVPAGQQTGLTQCDEHSHGDMGGFERAAHKVLHYAERALSPKNAYAYDQGPEHEFSFFSNFNAVDPASGPDLAVSGITAPASGRGGTAIQVSYSVTNRSRRTGGQATATSAPAEARVFLSSDAQLSEDDSQVTETPDAIPALVPDGESAVFTHSVLLPVGGGTRHVIVQVIQNAGGLTEVSLDNNVDAKPVAIDDDFIGIWNGTISPPGATPETGQPVTLIVTSRDGGTCTGEFRVAQVLGGFAYNTTRQFTACDVEGTTHLFADINPWVNPLNSAVRSTFALERTGTAMTGLAVRYFLVNEVPTPEASPWKLTLTLGTTPIVLLPPPGLRALKTAALTSNWY